MLFIYSVYDKIKKSQLVTFTSPNDGCAIRDNARGINAIVPLNDTELRCVGELDDKTGLITKSYSSTDESYHVVEWDNYGFPESPLSTLSKEQITVLQRQIKQMQLENIR